MLSSNSGKERFIMLWIDGSNFFDKPIRNDLNTYDQTKKISTGQDDSYTTGFLPDYAYFKKYGKLIAIDLSK